MLVATIRGQTFHYNLLTANDIYSYLNTTRINFGNPTHLFMTEQGIQDLSSDVSGWYGVDTQTKAPLLMMFMGMHVVVLPGLHEDTLIIGTLNLLGE